MCERICRPALRGSPEPVAVEPVVAGIGDPLPADGVGSEWGRVLVWEPPRRIVLSWQITANRFTAAVAS